MILFFSICEFYAKYTAFSRTGFKIYYELKETTIKSDEKVDGTFVIQSNEKNYDDEKLIMIYKNLNKVENAFKIIKNDLNIRPIHHYKEARVEGHVYVCVLAYFIINAIDYIARNKRLNRSARKILRQLSHISLLDINLPNGRKRYSITTIQSDHKKLLDAYNIKRVNIPNVV